MQANPPTQPETIRRLENSVWLGYAMLAGMQLDIFTSLAAGPLTAEQLGHTLGAGTVRLRSLLYALVAAGLLTVEEEQFANTSESNYFLVRGSPGYMGSIHGSYATAWPTGLKTADSIRTDSPQAK
ncbi:MAG: hypothetical protein LC737_01910, partial [Chloroflexi bacterium]|nr:hypothetical protein [Chloroflexota bacterium]